MTDVSAPPPDWKPPAGPKYPDLAEAIVQTMDQPLLILRGDLTVEECNRAFNSLFQVSPGETTGRKVFDLGNGQWDIPELRILLGEILPQKTVVTDYPVAHDFPSIGRRIMWLSARRIPPANDRDELILLFITDKTEIERTRAELEGQREFQTKLIDSIREGLLVLDPELHVIQANKSFYDMFEVDEAESEGVRLPDLGNGQWNIPRLRTLLEDVLPENNAFNDALVEHDFERIGHKVMSLNGRRLDHMDLILLAIRDVTDRHREEQQRTVMGELHHRLKNMLISVKSLANQTVGFSSSLDEFQKAFDMRLDGLARAQDMLMHAPKDGLPLEEIMTLELEAQGGTDGQQFTCEGPHVLLSPSDAQSFAMVIHELTTNAVKYGALSVPDGRIDVSWEAERSGESAKVRLRWREYGVRIEEQPSRTGYGTRVMKGIFSHTLKGRSDLTLHGDGAEFVAEFELR
jgi:two-component sensor histidine kinase